MHSVHYVPSGTSKSRSCLRSYTTIKAKRWPCLCGERESAQSIVLAQVAEDLLPESEAKVSSIERRLQRDVA
jgi:hypothetical protein